MHKIFVTEGLVLSKRGVGEANTLVALFSPHLGLVRASARSARREVSKLRYGLEPLTRARFSLVRGRAEWKLIGVESVSYDCRPLDPAQRTRAGKIARLLLRLIHGEEQAPLLFATVCEGLQCLARIESSEEAALLECVLVLRVMAQLGYVPHTLELAPFIEQDLFALLLSAEMHASKPQLIRTINASLNATGL